MELCPSLELGVVATEKGSLASPSTKGDNFTFTLYNDLLIDFYYNLVQPALQWIGNIKHRKGFPKSNKQTLSQS